MQAYSVFSALGCISYGFLLEGTRGSLTTRATKAEVEEHPSFQMKAKGDGGEQIIPSCTNATFLT